MIRAILNAIAAGLALLAFSTCYAGGENWRFAVTSFTSDGKDKYVLELTPVDKDNNFPNSCTRLTVVGEYASLFWFFKFGDGPSREEHKVALALLGNAFKSKTQINFGWIGDGIDVTARTGACTARSRGLMAEGAVDGDAVYSYFKWP